MLRPYRISRAADAPHLQDVLGWFFPGPKPFQLEQLPACSFHIQRRPGLSSSPPKCAGRYQRHGCHVPLWQRQRKVPLYLS